MIDRYDAPDGMVAVRCNNEYDLCEGCHYYSDMLSLEGCDRRCGDLNRLDNTDVIFVTRADFEAMLKQEIAQFYGFEKDDVVILIRHEDKPK